MLPKPIVDKTTEIKSKGSLRVSRTLCMIQKLAITTTATIGIIMPKRSRQVQLSMTHPDKVGPMAGARPITIPASPMAVPRLLAGKMVSINVCSKGMETPTPTAWINRPMSNIGKLTADQQRTVPSKKVDMAPMYSHFELMVLSNQALMGIMIPLTSKNPVVNH